MGCRLMMEVKAINPCFPPASLLFDESRLGLGRYRRHCADIRGSVMAASAGPGPGTVGWLTSLVLLPTHATMLGSGRVLFRHASLVTTQHSDTAVLNATNHCRRRVGYFLDKQQEI